MAAMYLVDQQNVTMLHRMVQQLGTSRDTFELRGQCKCQLEVVNELREKIQTQVCVSVLSVYALIVLY